MKRKKIIFVCTGNTCRSPMAEAVLKDELKKRKIRWYSVSSAGLRAEEGSGLNPKSAAVLSDADIPVPAFASRQLTEKMIAEATAVVCMTETQRRELARYSNVTSMYALAGREIPDPYGQDVLVYRETLRAICAAMPYVIEKLGIRNEEGEGAAPAKAKKAPAAAKKGKAGSTARTSKSAVGARSAKSPKSGGGAKTPTMKSSGSGTPKKKNTAKKKPTKS